MFCECYKKIEPLFLLFFLIFWKWKLFWKHWNKSSRNLFTKFKCRFEKWSVVACDQYTSQPDYWAEVENYVGSNPSTLHIILPEIYLEWADEKQRIENIKSNIVKYVNEGVLENKWAGFVYLDRQTSHALSRKWLIVALDLEKYDYSKWSQTLIRASEWTIVDRLPPRIKIRDGALMESPHILVLIDDPQKLL